MNEILLVVTGTLLAMLTGFFFGWSVSVMGGLGRLSDGEYVRAMQSINKVILNPLFFIIFMGPVVLLPWVTLLYADNGMFIALLGSSILYVVGTFGVTIAGNVPLNDRLDKASESDAPKVRAAFESKWNRLHTFRTVCGVLSTVLFFVACIYG